MWQMGCLFCSVSWAKCKQKSLIPKAKLTTKFNQNLFTSVCNTLLANKQPNAAENRSLLRDVCGLWTFYKYDAGCSLVPLIQQPTHTQILTSLLCRGHVVTDWWHQFSLSERWTTCRCRTSHDQPLYTDSMAGGCVERTPAHKSECVCVWMCVCVSCTGNACRATSTEVSRGEWWLN